jgi:transposase
VPHGHWKTTTFTGALRLTGMTAPFVYDGAMNGAVFLAYVDQVLVPTLKPGDVVVMDMCGRPRLCKKNSSKSAERGRVLTCVRPLMRLSHAAGPYGSSRSGSNSTWRARGAYPSSGFPDPVSLTVAPYSPFDLLTLRQLAQRSELALQDRCPIGPALGH